MEKKRSDWREILLPVEYKVSFHQIVIVNYDEEVHYWQVNYCNEGLIINVHIRTWSVVVALQ